MGGHRPMDAEELLRAHFASEIEAERLALHSKAEPAVFRCGPAFPKRGIGARRAWVPETAMAAALAVGILVYTLASPGELASRLSDSATWRGVEHIGGTIRKGMTAAVQDFKADEVQAGSRTRSLGRYQ